MSRIRLLPFILLGTVAMVLFVPMITPIQADTEGYTYLIGMSQCNLGEPWRIQMNKDVTLAAEQYPEMKVIFTDASESSEKQIEDVRELMRLGIDLLIISPLEAEPLTQIISEVNEQLPVIVLDRKTTNDEYTLFIGADNREIGRNAGEYVAAQFAGRDCAVAELYGLPGSTPAVERSEGFRAAIESYPNIQVVGSIVADWLRDPAEDGFYQYMQSDKAQPIDVVFSHNDPMALGAYRAAQRLGMDADMTFIGIDGLMEGEEAGLSLVGNGILDITYTYPTGGKQAVECAVAILGGEQFSDKQIILGHDSIDRDNWQRILADTLPQGSETNSTIE